MGTVPTRATTTCLTSSRVYPTGCGTIFVKVMSNNTLQGHHYCNHTMPGGWPMLFFRPESSCWKLVCENCHYAIYFLGLDCFDFPKDFPRVMAIIELQAREQGVPIDVLRNILLSNM